MGVKPRFEREGIAAWIRDRGTGAIKRRQFLCGRWYQPCGEKELFDFPGDFHSSQLESLPACQADACADDAAS